MDMSVAAAYAAGGTFQAPVTAPRAPHQQRVSLELLLHTEQPAGFITVLLNNLRQLTY